jgi:VWFA-related protein
MATVSQITLSQTNLGRTKLGRMKLGRIKLGRTVTASPVRTNRWRGCAPLVPLGLALFCLALLPAAPLLQAQSGTNQQQSQSQTQPQSQTQGKSQTQPPANSQSDQDIPDAPSVVQPPSPKPSFPPGAADQSPADEIQQNEGSSSSAPTQNQQKPTPPPMPPIETVPPGSVPLQNGPRNQINPAEGLYIIKTTANFVVLPVMVKDDEGRRVDGLRYTDFTVKENDREQKLTFFSSDPLPLSVAIVLDVGMPDVALQKINQTYGSLVGAFSAYDEVALYTYSSTVTQVTDFSEHNETLTAALNEMKLVRGADNGPPILGGPLASGPTINGAPPGGPIIAPVNTPTREAHVLNDAILQAALDLGKRPRDRRKVIFVISDGKELGSKASYRDVLKVLETRNIQVKAVVVDTGALPVFKQLARFRIKDQGYTDILPKYAIATGGGQPYTELSRNAIEDAYQSLTSDARNQYTLGYTPQATTGSSAYRSIEVIVHRGGLKVIAKAGYYPIPQGR